MPALALLCAIGVWVTSALTVFGSTRTFHVRDYGAVPDGQTDAGPALRAALHAALAAGPGTEVRLDRGVYRVSPAAPRQICLPVHQATNLVIRGEPGQTLLVVTDPAAGAFGFGTCEKVIIRDLAIDYDPLPFCQGTIRAVDRQAGTFDLEVAAGYPTPDASNFIQAIEPYGKWGMIMDPALRRIRTGTPDHYMTPRWEHRGDRTWRFSVADEHHRRNLEHMRVGDAYVHLARGHGSAIFAQACQDIAIENVTVHAAPGLAVGLVGNQGEILVRRLQVRFAPGTSRLLTANADGVHCQQNRSGPVIEDCYFEGMADDAVNIYAPPNVLREIRSGTEWLVSAGTLLRTGDRLQVLDPVAGRVRGEVRVLNVNPEPRGVLIRIETALAGARAGADHRTADTLYNLDACGAGFQIRRNHMNGHRRYGCLLRAGRGQVEDNLFEDTTGAGVVLTNEPDWPEGPVPWDITIRRNRFLRGGTCLGYADSRHGAALTVRATRLGHGLAEAEAIRNVVIENNSFEDRAGIALFVGGASDVRVLNNHIFAGTGAQRRQAGPGILVEQSSGVALADNRIVDVRAGTTAALEIGSNVPKGDAGLRVSGLETQLAPDSQPILDRRGTP